MWILPAFLQDDLKASLIAGEGEPSHKDELSKLPVEVCQDMRMSSSLVVAKA